MEAIKQTLDSFFPSPQCELKFKSNFELLVAVILSAQCTDKRVNEVTEKMFKKWNTPQHFASLEQKTLENEIHSLGFFRNKAKSIISASRDIVEKFGGEVPNNMQDLCSLAGVGRKTASVILSEAFKQPAFAVDTHVFRVANRLGIGGRTVEECEENLKKFFPKSEWSKIHLQMVLFGRYHCTARNPNCANCKLASICKFNEQ